jgi:hypothetical protein
MAVAQIVPTTTRWKHIGTLGGIAASAAPAMDINIPNNIHSLYCVCRAAGGAVLTRAQMITDIASIQVQLNGEDIYNLTMTHNLDLYKWQFDRFGALAAPLGVIHIPFTRIGLPAWDLNRAFAVGMLRNSGSGLNNMTVRFFLTAGLTTMASMRIYAEYDLYDPEPTGAHIRTLRYTSSFAGTGEQFITTEVNHAQAGILAYHFIGVVPGTGTVTFFTVTKNNQFIREYADYDALQIEMDRAGRTPQTNYIHLPFDLNNDLNGMERLGPDVSWVIRPTWTVAPGVGYTIIAEEVHDGIPG